MQEYLPMAIGICQKSYFDGNSVIAIFIMVVYTFFKSLIIKSKTIDNTELVRIINSQDATVIDIRTVDEFERGHIINSIHLLPTEIKKIITLVKSNITKNSVVLVCATGMNAIVLRRATSKNKGLLKFKAERRYYRLVFFKFTILLKNIN